MPIDPASVSDRAQTVILYSAFVLTDESFDLFQEFVAHKVALLHQCLDLSLQTIFFFGGKFLGCGNDYWNLGSIGVGSERIKNGKPIHFWHHQIQNEQVRVFTLNKVETFPAITGLENSEVTL